MAIKFGRDICCELNNSEKREWLVTNGIGGYASGTVAGMLTRRYHGLLVAALKPPLGRNLLVAKFDETASYNGVNYPLSSNRWADGSIDPNGYIYIESFSLDGTMPVWNYALADAILEKRIWMKKGENTTFVRYMILRAGGPIDLSIKAFVNYRDYHGTTRSGNWNIKVDEINQGIRINAYDGAVPVYILADKAKVKISNEWYYGFDLAQEKYRGLDYREDHLNAGTLSATLSAGESLTIVTGTDESAVSDGPRELRQFREYEQELIEKFSSVKGKNPVIKSCDFDRLALAADQFIVDRPVKKDRVGKSIIAGYHWFGDWGRDTMISIPGLAIHTGRVSIAKSILETFANYVDKGMLPNRFPDEGEAPEYNTVDATLWYFEAIRQYFEATKDVSFLKELYPVLEEIVDWHFKGTRYNIKVDPEDGLLYAGAEGIQLTWMDAKVGDRVITPRIGKPVEVNALWYNALFSMSRFAKSLKRPYKKYETAAEQALDGFALFWNEGKNYCYDVIDGPGGNDPALRPNQIFALSLPESPLPPDRQEKVIEACSLDLLTSHGLRSLSPEHPDYRGHYGGGQKERDGAYHQGTVWGWLLGHFALAHLRVYKDRRKARDFLAPILEQLSSHGIGTLSEISDGDAPMTPRGCIAQAWTVAETIRALSVIEEFKVK